MRFDYKIPDELPRDMKEYLHIHLDIIAKSINNLSPHKFFQKVNPQIHLVGKNIVLSIGKQATDFFYGFKKWFHEDISKAFIVQPTGYDTNEIIQKDNVFIYYTSHPISSHETFEATKNVIMKLDELCNKDVTLHVLVSGGASASFALPEDGISESNYNEIVTAAMKDGFTIHELNMVRGLIDSIKAGKLAARYPETTINTYIISDVPRDDPAVVGSGPTIPGLIPNSKIVQWIKEKIKAIDLPLSFEHLNEMLLLANPPEISNTNNHYIMCTKNDLIDELIHQLSKSNIEYEVFTDGIDLDVKDVANLIYEQIRFKLSLDYPLGSKHTLVFAGEPTVTLKGKSIGKGGRVSSVAMHISDLINSNDNIIFIGIATDGSDGSSPHPGYIITNKTSNHLRPLGGEKRIIIKQNTGGALSSLGYGLSFKDTKINLMDLYVVILA